jgi:carboxyl-terminal processing protease
MLPNDRILAVDDEAIDGWSLQQVVDHIRGEKGTPVALVIGREGQAEPLKLSIVREAITVPSVESAVRETDKGKIGVLTLNQFGEHSYDEIKAALIDVKKQGAKGLILDLRFNGGGYLDGAVSIGSLFLKEGVIVSVRHRGDAADNRTATGNPLEPDLPLLVLINQGSASASEILAGALQDHERGTIMGMKSFGKGTVQDVIDLAANASLRVTSAKWFTPKGRDISKHGIDPDIVVDRTAEDVAANRDPQMDEAVKWVEARL